MKNEPFVIERIYNAPIERVWSAITDKEKMKQWYFDLEEFRAEVGFEFQFVAAEDPNQYLHLCRVTEVIPNQKLSYTWRYDGYEGDTVVSFGLHAEGDDKTKLTLTHEGLETLAVNNNPHFNKENFVRGWTDFIGTALKQFVEA